MAISVFVASRNGVFWEEEPPNLIYEYIGEIEEDDVDFADKLKNNSAIKLLRFIGPLDNTVFNHKQLNQIKKELALLKTNNVLNKNIVTTIEKGLAKALESSELYLKFDAD